MSRGKGPTPKPTPPPERTLDLPAAAAAACATFALAFGLFRWFQPSILAVRTSLTPADFMFWAHDAASEQDGREVPVALTGLLACIGACFAITRSGLGKRVLAFKFVRWTCYALAGAVVASTRSGEFSNDGRTFLPLVTAAAFLLGFVWKVYGSAAWRRARIVTAVLFATVVVVVLFLTVGNPSISDYGYFIGPALEWIQGEPLGAFYMQYNLLGTLVMTAFVRLGMHINGMQWTLAALTLGWFALYVWLARTWIRDPALRMLFLVSLFAFRMLWLRHHIAALPQVSPLRLELWVPLLLVARKQGLLSPWTACSFAAVYALDSLFGLFYLGVYLAFAAVELRDLARRGGLQARTVITILAPVAVGGVINWALFGSLVAGSATHYLDVKLGFLPIPPASLFWVVLLILLFAVVVFARAGAEGRFGMLLVLLTTAQMIYFLGRSHDHNLVNIGGTWLFVAFTALDAIRSEAPRLAKTAASALILGIFGLGSQRIADAVGKGFDRLVHGSWFEEHALDRFLDGTRPAWPTNTPNVILLGMEDAYINYRLGLRQHGYYSPIYAHILIEETATFLHGEMTQGNRVIVPVVSPSTLPELQDAVGEMNHTRFMTGRSSAFGVNSSVSRFFYEIALAR